MPLFKLALRAHVIVAFLLVADCARNPGATTGPGPVPPRPSAATAAFYKNNGWVPLPEPDSRFEPGTIFDLDEKTGVRYLSSLQTCGVPATVLTPVTNNTGTFTNLASAEYGASAPLKIAGVSVGPEFKRIQKTTFAQSDAGASSFDLIQVLIWLGRNAASFEPVCKEFLARPGVFIAQEAYRVGQGKYTLHDNTGAKLDIKGIKTQFLTIDPSANVKVEQDSTLVLTVPVYTAVRRIVYADGVFQVLGGASPTAKPDADKDINQKLPY